MMGTTKMYSKLLACIGILFIAVVMALKFNSIRASSVHVKMDVIHDHATPMARTVTVTKIKHTRGFKKQRIRMQHARVRPSNTSIHGGGRARRRYHFVPTRHSNPKFTLHLPANTSITDYQYQQFYDLRSNVSNICTSLNVHGLPKSGTTWLETVLRIISMQYCVKTQSDMCDKQNIGHALKHALAEKDQVLHFNKIHRREFAVSPSNSDFRFCMFIALRDFRDRLVSYAHFHYRDEDHTLDTLQKHIIKDTQTFIVDLSMWYDVYGRLEQLYPTTYFNYFYEDLTTNTKHVIDRMVNFIGLGQLLDEDDLINITQHVQWDMLQKNNLNTYRSKRNQNRSTNCQQHELTNETKKYIYDTVENLTIPLVLLRKMDETCSVPSYLLHA
eukprot:803901_1